MILSSKTTLKKTSFDDPTLKLAFDELADMLKRSVGVSCEDNGRIEVVFSIDRVQGYCVRLENNSIIFDASNELGILYAVYTFAEEFLGFCFIEPGNDLLVAPGKIELCEGSIISLQKPAIKRRGLIQEFPFDERTLLLADWMAKNRLNYLLVWMKYYDRLDEKIKREFRIRGIEIECGHHNFEYFIPAEEYYNTHPEFFAIIDGKRIKPDITDEGFLAGGQLCTTDPGLRSELVKNIIAYCRRNPEVKTISLIPNDGFGWCECSLCREVAGDMKKGELFSLSSHVYESQQLYHDLIRHVSEELKKVIPDVTLTFAAYINYLKPAKGFELSEKQAVHFALYWRCVNHLINDPQCPINSRYVEKLLQWQKVKDGGDINIYEYYMGVNLYISLPMMHHQKVFEEVSFYRENKIDGLLTQFQFDNWTAYGTNYYLMARAAYGEGAECIERLYKSLMPDEPQRIRQFYDFAQEITDSTGPCHITYPRALLKRTKFEQYKRLHQQAKEISGSVKNGFTEKLEIWTEYLLRFKKVFDSYISNDKDTARKIVEFINWAENYRSCNIFVYKNFSILMHKWLERIKNNEQWYHYGLDWEDEYIKIHDRVLNDPKEFERANNG